MMPPRPSPGESGLPMPKSAPGPRVVRLVRLRKGPLGAVFGLLFVLATALPLAYGCLLGWSLSRAGGGAIRWPGRS